MIGFFAKKPGIGTLTMLAVFVAGGILAHRSSSPVDLSTAVALTTAKKLKPRKKVALAPIRDWREHVNINRAVVRDGVLQQRLRDGTSISFTIDPQLQQWATDYLKSYELPYGAMVMSDLRSGKVLVMAGHSERNSEVGVAELCLRPWAPAASVFKLVTATGLLARGVPANAQVCYHGGMRGLNKSHIKDIPKLDTTCRSLSYAIAKSVNPIMGKLAIRYLGHKGLKLWSERLGFNRRIPFDIPVGRSRAAIPKKDLPLARVAAGFWHTDLSPLHGSVIAGMAANRGVLRWPHVVRSVRRPHKGLFVPQRPVAKRVLSRIKARQLARMMVRTTKIGSGRRGFYNRRGRPFLRGVEVGGKTGSLARKHPFLNYSWFVGFAPADKPQVAFAVLLGNPARWRIKASTAARNLVQRYLKNQRAKRKKTKVAAAKRSKTRRLLALKQPKPRR